MLKKLLLMGMVVSLVACGGGGGSEGGSSTPAPLSFTPAAIVETCGEGDFLEFSVSATPNVTFTAPVFIRVVDSVGVLDVNGFRIVSNPDGTYTATLKTVDSMAKGTHNGSLSVEVCNDYLCTSPYPGSPIALPYTFEVISSTNLTPISAWTGIADWETYQGNAAHMGYVPVTLDAADFSSRYRWFSPYVNAAIRPVVTADDLVYVVSSGAFATESTLFALNETDYSTLWNYDFGSVYKVNNPAVTGGNVYVATSGHGDTAMWSFTADTGVERFNTPFSSQWSAYYAPTVYNGTVFTNGGYNGGMNAFDATTGSSAWFTGLNQYDQWTPAVDANYAYAYIGESCSGCANAGLNIIDKATGTVVNRIIDSYFNWNGWSIGGAPIITSSNTVLSINQASKLYQNRLISFDITNLDMNWTVSGIFNVNPAVADSVIYLANNSPYQLEARDEITGLLLWAWTPPETDETYFYGNVIATDNMTFVSTDKRVYAIDNSTHLEVWSYWKPGHLAISNNGILYITTSDGVKSDGAVVAINLK